MRRFYLFVAACCVVGIVAGFFAVPSRLGAAVWPAATLGWVVVAYLWEAHPDGPWWRT